MYQIFNPNKSLLHLSSIVNSYKEFKIAKAKEIATRTICREQSKIAIAEIVEILNHCICSEPLLAQ